MLITLDLLIKPDAMTTIFVMVVILYLHSQVFFIISWWPLEFGHFLHQNW